MIIERNKTVRQIYGVNESIFMLQRRLIRANGLPDGF